MIKLTFHGAAETVTGSKYLLETETAKVLIDYGMFQGKKENRLRNWEKPAFDPAEIQAVVLTHAHIDHSGLLPKLVKEGFRQKIYCTPATADLCELLLLDSAKIQEEDAEYANRKKFSKHHPALPLFDAQDAAKSLRQLFAQELNAWFAPVDGIRMKYHDTGHLLGAAMIEVEVEREGKEPLRLLFSGDVGRYDAPLYHDPKPPVPCDVLICESTYGDRDHPETDMMEELAQAVLASIRRGGVMLVAAFAIGRAQQLIYLLRLLIEQNRIPELPIFLDSPMAVDATNIFCKFAADHDLSEGELAETHCVLTGRNVHLSRTVAESKQINQVKGPAIIISSSGMMTGGRILHHLRQRLPDSRNTVMLAGYQAEGTRGRRLEDGESTLRLHGRDIPAKAAVVRVPGLSGHAGRSELLRWLAPLAAPRRTFITHGELPSAESFAAALRQRDWEVEVPKIGQGVELSDL